MKLVKILVITAVLNLVQAYSMIDLVNDSNEKVINLVGRLLKQWSREHDGRNEVAIVNIGKGENIARDLARQIPPDFSVIFPNKKRPKQYVTGKSTFIIILSDIYEAVSGLGVVFRLIELCFCEKSICVSMLSLLAIRKKNVHFLYF